MKILSPFISPMRRNAEKRTNFLPVAIQGCIQKDFIDLFLDYKLFPAARRSFSFLVLLATTVVCQAQTPGRDPVISPEVHEDRTVTFRLYGPEAKAVKVWVEWNHQDIDMKAGDGGVWSATVGPMASDLYGYSFKVDGITMLDPVNPVAKPSRSVTQSALEIPGEKDAPIDPISGVPRGTVHLHDYDSKSLGRVRRLRVYTPPVYNAHNNVRLPVLYLFHGSGDNEASWSEFGRANVILDNLNAAKKAVPMVVVMTDGHAAPGYSRASWAENLSSFERDLLEDVIPFVEAHYLVSTKREDRAIAGLSMGGNQALLIGLNHRDLFSWIGGMSSAVREPEKPLAAFWADPVSTKTPLSLLWLTIGTDDFLLKENRAFDAMLTGKKVPHEYVETAGRHEWMVWRRGLATFVARLFKPDLAEHA